MIDVNEDGDVTFYVPTVDLSSYAVGYSFRTPVPLPASWVNTTTSTTLQSERESSKQDEDDNNVDLMVSASIAGALNPMVQRFLVRYEDGTEETKEVCHCAHMDAECWKLTRFRCLCHLDWLGEI